MNTKQRVKHAINNHSKTQVAESKRHAFLSLFCKYYFIVSGFEMSIASIVPIIGKFDWYIFKIEESDQYVTWKTINN